MPTRQYVLRPEIPGEYRTMSDIVEKDVLGKLLLDIHSDACDVIDPGWFGNYHHLMIFKAIHYQRGFERPGDILSIIGVLEEKHLLDDIGGLSAIAEMATEVSTISVEHLAPMMEQLALMRYYTARHLVRGKKRQLVRLADAVENNWLHGKAWRAFDSHFDTATGSRKNIWQFEPDWEDWACYIYLEPRSRQKKERPGE